MDAPVNQGDHDQAQCTPTLEAPSERLMAIEVTLDDRVDFAKDQNEVPILRRLRLANLADVPIEDISVDLSIEAREPVTHQVRIASIGAGSSHTLTNDLIGLRLPHKMLRSLGEREKADLIISVSAGEKLLARESHPLTLLPVNHWSGTQPLPEILCAYCLPNHPALNGILKTSATILKEKTSDASFSGYQLKDSRRAWAQAAALYSALSRQGLTYVNPPSSFERHGQKVLFPDQILARCMGTCLDVTLLYCALAERVGLRPIIMLAESHALAAVWLEEERLPESIIEGDPTALTKRENLGKLICIDVTGVTCTPPMRFEDALKSSRKHLVETVDSVEAPKSFFAIDVVACREIHRIHPLPLHAVSEVQSDLGDGSVEKGDEVPQWTIPESRATRRRSTGNTPRPDRPREPLTAPARLERWKARLLDLTYRNRLLNYRESASHLQLLGSDIPTLEDSLTNGVAFSIESLDNPSITDRDLDAFLKDELRRKTIRVRQKPEKLSGSLTKIHRGAREALLESGSNTLYLALGMLVHYESGCSAKPRRAPVLLMPVSLERSPGGQTFTLKKTDEDTRINLTLLKKLESDFSLFIRGLDPLPEDDAGLDVELIFETVEDHIVDRERWELRREIYLGPLSFTKFLMWKDLEDRADELAKNPLVRHLIESPNRPYRDQPDLPSPRSLDRKFPPSSVLCPLDADSSQLRAILAASKGGTFVLEGPPGTGKSQTITNLIAQALASEKTVLFVAEKLAALEVVYGRLTKIGLDPFCLELHSNKIQKSVVLKQLEVALDSRGIIEPSDWSERTSRLDSRRRELNDVVDALHRPRKLGLSIFQATARRIAIEDAPALPLKCHRGQKLSADDYLELKDKLNQFSKAVEIIGPPAAHPWFGCNGRLTSPRDLRHAQETLAELQTSLEAVTAPLDAVASALGLAKGTMSFEALDGLVDLSERLRKAPLVQEKCLSPQAWEEVREASLEWIEMGEERDALCRELAERYEVDRLLASDLDELRNRIQIAGESIFFLRWWRLWRARTALGRSATGKLKRSMEETTKDLDLATKARDLRRILEARSTEASDTFGHLWKDGHPDWQVLREVVDFLDAMHSRVPVIARDDLEARSKLRNKLRSLLIEGRDLVTGDASLGKHMDELSTAWARYRSAREGFAVLVDSRDEDAFDPPSKPGHIERAFEQFQSRLDSRKDLPDWANYLNAADGLDDAKLHEIVDAVEAGTLPHQKVIDCFDRHFLQLWLEREIDGDPALRSFQGKSHQEKIREFRSLDEEVLSLASTVIRARLSERIPAGTSSRSEVGVLRREIQKKRRHMPIRRLLPAIANVLPRLCPCLLMSPLSVAQYLDVEFPPFDLIVFDEASQIPVWDAIGAMARGKSVIVVGDSKQLPPTSFFQKADVEDDLDLEEDVEDLDSILEECVGASVPRLTLDWHYRSQHETLIAFSNHHYYDNRLLVFPSASKRMEGLGVRYRHVPDGFYDTGKSRTNQREAECIVEEVIRRLHDPELSRYSLGIVTFSSAQQTRVEDLLDKALSDPAHESIRRFFTDDHPEPVFVKNLENVQGDERDVILFSICYGPDRTGLVRMRFGPLNRQGGERRLNVAVTRARRELVVFSTLRAEHIDLTRVRWPGVAHLKTFLDYAERGLRAIDEASSIDHTADCESPFEREVHAALVERGWEVVPQVGCSGYRIDLAVKDPDNPGRFLLGIECDGASYHSAATARDRDRLREQVLRSLGWRIHRIWSTDWWMFRDSEIDRLVKAIEKARALGPVTKASSGRHRPVQIAARGQSPSTGAAASLGCPPQRFAGAVPASKPSARSFRPDEETPYLAWSCTMRQRDQELLYDPRSESTMSEIVAAIVEAEAPVDFDRVVRLAIGVWGQTKVTAKARKHVRRLIRMMSESQRPVDQGGFLWRADQDPASFTRYRVPSSDPETQRKAEEIPPEEIANAACVILREEVALPSEDLVRETANRFGISRVGKKVQEAITKGIALAKKRDGVHCENETIRWEA